MPGEQLTQKPFASSASTPSRNKHCTGNPSQASTQCARTPRMLPPNRKGVHAADNVSTSPENDTMPNYSSMPECARSRSTAKCSESYENAAFTKKPKTESASV